MAFRTAALMKLAGATPQPLFGLWITLASGNAGAFGPANMPIVLTLGTACNAGNDATQLFQYGDPVFIIDPNGANAERARIQSISGNTVTLGVQNFGTGPVLQNPHVAGVFGTGSFIMLASDVNNIFVQYEDGGTGPFLYIGNQYNFTAVFKRISKLAVAATNVQPFFFNATENFFGAPFPAHELWVLGIAGDKWTPSLGVL